jgi:adenylosuccinate lyase
MDQISEHQRDLSNSASQRFIADYITGFCLAISRMSELMKGLKSDREKCLYNLYSSGGVKGAVLAEPAYILLAESGASDAHEIIRKITLAAEKKGLSFSDALAEEKEIQQRIGAKLIKLGIGTETEDPVNAAAVFFGKSENYRGLAAKKAKELAAKYRKLMED